MEIRTSTHRMEHAPTAQEHGCSADPARDRRALVVHAGRHGQAQEITRLLANQLSSRGIEYTVAEVSAMPNVMAPFLILFLVASIKFGRFRREIRPFIQTQMGAGSESPDGDRYVDWPGVDHITDDAFIRQLHRAFPSPSAHCL